MHATQPPRRRAAARPVPLAFLAAGERVRDCAALFLLGRTARGGLTTGRRPRGRGAKSEARIIPSSSPVSYPPLSRSNAASAALDLIGRVARAECVGGQGSPVASMALSAPLGARLDIVARFVGGGLSGGGRGRDDAGGGRGRTTARRHRRRRRRGGDVPAHAHRPRSETRAFVLVELAEVPLERRRWGQSGSSSCCVDDS